MARVDDFNLDPLTKEPGAHPLGTGVGAAVGGAAAGAVLGTFAGPAGALVGAVAGAVAGGLGGKAAAESVNPTAEQAYWASAYEQEPYYEAGRPFTDYAPAYQLGAQARVQYPGTFDEMETRLATHWESQKDRSLLSWQQARAATFAAWERAGQQVDSAPDWRAPDNHEPGPLVYGDVLSSLNALLEACRDGENGFRECADYSQADNLKELLNRYAQETLGNGAELKSYIRELGGKAEDSGSVSSALHRGWVSVRGTLTGHSPQSMLSECERVQDTLLAAYSQAHDTGLPAHIAQALTQQAEGVQKNRDRIKELQDMLKTED